MMKSRDYLFFGLVTIVVAIASCSNPVRDEEEAIQKAYEDSLAQAGVDETIIDDFWVDNGYDDLEIQDKDSLTGLRYAVLVDQGGQRKAEINDIVSIHYIGRFADGEVFDTTIDTLAIRLDSNAWVERWESYTLAENSFIVDTLYIGEERNEDGVLVPIDTLDVEGFTLEEKLNTLLTSSDPLENSFYSSSRAFEPWTYNHTFNGAGIPPSITGFRDGVHWLTPRLSVGSSGVMVFPSAIGYGVKGTPNGTIPPNTVLSFEIIMENIRP